MTLTLKEAIKILEEGQSHLWFRYKAEREPALKLGIEALKLNLEMRETYHAPELLVLPGETEE